MPWGAAFISSARGQETFIHLLKRWEWRCVCKSSPGSSSQRFRSLSTNLPLTQALPFHHSLSLPGCRLMIPHIFLSLCKTCNSRRPSLIPGTCRRSGARGAQSRRLRGLLAWQTDPAGLSAGTSLRCTLAFLSVHVASLHFERKTTCQSMAESLAGCEDVKGQNFLFFFLFLWFSEDRTI